MYTTATVEDAEDDKVSHFYTQYVILYMCTYLSDILRNLHQLLIIVWVNRSKSAALNSQASARCIVSK